MTEKIRKEIKISGRVQGVGFRAFTRRSAQKNSVTGWVKNLFDGRVQAVLEGEADQVGLVIEKLRQGPSFARVSEIEIKDLDYTGEFDRFNIRY